MAAYLRRLVSKNKRRIYQDGFDLDLSYITPRIIAMGLPVDGAEGFFRNRLPTVNKFLTNFHGSKVRVYNLCSERVYDASKLGGNVVCFPFDDHQVPSLQLMIDFCQNAEAFLQADPENVIAVHCKAGKGRTGVMIIAFLLHTGAFTDPEAALREYAARRTTDGRAITIPSQRRYVHYFYSHIVSAGLLRAPRPAPLRLNHLSLLGLPADAADRLSVVIWAREEGLPLRPHPLAILVAHEARLRISSRFAGIRPIHVPSLRVFQGTAAISFNDDHMWDIAGDFKLEVYRDDLRAKHLMCYAWLNTTCLARDLGGQAQVTLQHQDLDKTDEACPRTLALHLRMQACNCADRPGRAHSLQASPFSWNSQARHAELTASPLSQRRASTGDRRSLRQHAATGGAEDSLGHESDSGDSEGSACLCSPTPGTMASVQARPAQSHAVQSHPVHSLSSADSPPPSPPAIQAQRPVPQLFTPGSFLGPLEAGAGGLLGSKPLVLQHSARGPSTMRLKAPRRHWSDLFRSTPRSDLQKPYPGTDRQPPDSRHRPHQLDLSSAPGDKEQMNAHDDILASFNDIWYGPMTAR